MFKITGKTHLVGGTIAALGMVTASKGSMDYWDMATCFACCEFGSLLPDIDTTSKITEEDLAFKAVSLGLKGLGVKHRGVTHTVWASALFGAAAYAVSLLVAGLINSSVSFLLACAVFLLIHIDNGAYAIRKFGSIIAVTVYLGVPVVMEHLPEGLMDMLPELKVVIDPLTVGMSVFFGCLSHLLWDTCNKEGIMWLHPFSKKRISVLPITTSGGGESIFAIVVTIAAMAWATYLLQAGYFVKL